MNRKHVYADFEGPQALGLAETLRSNRQVAAQDAYEAYDFGDLRVELRYKSNWTFSFIGGTVPVMFRTISIFPEGLDCPAVQARFIVEFKGDDAMVTDAFASSDNRTKWGKLPEGYLDFGRAASTLRM